jgi:hypothetical protein
VDSLDQAKALGFMMVRGISDMPGTTGSGTQERDAWKAYASALAASFVARWIASSWWPTVPRS